MKLLSYLLLNVIIFSACHPSSPDNPEPDYTPTPTPVMVATAITTYLSPENPVQYPGSMVVINNVFSNYTLGYACFNFNRTDYDQYNTLFGAIKTGPGYGYFPTRRIIPLTGAFMNYAETRLFRYDLDDFFDANNDEERHFANGVILRTKANSFNTPNSLEISASYLDPASPYFGITTPITFADYDDKRWFIRSYGVTLLKIETQGGSIKPTGDVRLIMPISASMQSEAPDSIETWLYDGSNNWERKGFAKKTSEGYEKKIDKPGIWNFAIPQKGLYMKFKIKTETGIPIVNAGVRINRDNNVMADGRTDSEGTLFCFLPANEDLELQLVNLPSGFPVVQSTSNFTRILPPFQAAAEVPIEIPVSSHWITAIKGSVKTCAGNLLSQGTVTITNELGFVRAQVPVENGQYKVALLMPDQVNWIKAFNTSLNEPGRDSAHLTRAGIENELNLTTCPRNDFLFTRYAIDGIQDSLTGNWNTPFNPSLAGYRGNTISPTRIICSNTSKGYEVASSAWNVGSFTNSLSDLFVNGVIRPIDQSKPNTIVITRCDLLVNGFIEGTIDAWYLQNNLSKHLVASFRVRRIT